MGEVVDFDPAAKRIMLADGAAFNEEMAGENRPREAA